MDTAKIARNSFLALTALASPLLAQAELVDRGAGLLYDTVLDVTWLADAGYAKTIGDDSDGLMSWIDAGNWVDALEYYDPIREVTYSDWRLPSLTPINGVSFNADDLLNDGTSEWGYNMTSSNNELAYMFYVNLGLNAEIDVDGNVQTNDFGVLSSYSDAGRADVGLVKNLQNGKYWYDLADDEVSSWRFDMMDGYQHVSFSKAINPWAVRDGDVAVLAVPEASTWMMWLAGLGFCGFLRRRNNLKQ